MRKGFFIHWRSLDSPFCCCCRGSVGTLTVVGVLLGIRAIRSESNIHWRLLIPSFCSLR